MPEKDRPHPPTLGDIIRQQRELAALPLRQLASMVGISNPYLSQIERGLRAPSDAVLESIARSLHTSADALHEQAAMLSENDPPAPAVVEAIRADPNLTGRQRQALVEVYTALTEATIARRHRRGRSLDDRRPGIDDPGPSEDGAAGYDPAAER